MENRLKRVLSLILAIVLVLGMMPANIVMAEDNPDVPDLGAQVEATTEPTTEPRLDSIIEFSATSLFS